ncbi:MAG TPA: hypothetical protein VJP87_10290 [Candidatus Acidoferrales bacterium]|nr:hypothetical protein [Candidatus Acidoferrales bacterium]
MYYQPLHWHNGLLERLDGPLHLRFLFQPAVAIFLGIKDGISDARKGEPAYFWSILTGMAHCGARLKAGLRSVGKVMILAFVLDAIYQAIAFRYFHLLGAVLAMLILAFIPYLLTRGPANRITKAWLERPKGASRRQPRHGVL